jgi:polysaccharide biosynthesis protein PslG
MPLFLALSLVLLLLAGASSASAASVAPSFFGIKADGVLDDAAAFGQEAPLMADAGVRTVRLPIRWPATEPEEGAPQLGALDAHVASAAQNGLDVLALVEQTPRWAAADRSTVFSAPRDPADLAAFLRLLIGRYGPQGTLWTERPELPKRPVRAWQIYNEPSLSRYWSARPYPRTYRRVLCAAYRAVHGADPGAKVVMAGLANDSWRAMRRLHEAGVRGCYDVAAVHPFSARPSNSLKITRLNRQVISRFGGRRTPIWITELTWPSAQGQLSDNLVGWEVTPSGQAERLRTAYGLYVRNARRLRLQRIYWHTWVTQDGNSRTPFEWSGLRRIRPDGTIVDKPAMRALRDMVRRYAR